jgi:hypothetical protein
MSAIAPQMSVIRPLRRVWPPPTGVTSSQTPAMSRRWRATTPPTRG